MALATPEKSPVRWPPLGDKWAYETPETLCSPPPMDTCNLKEVTSALSISRKEACSLSRNFFFVISGGMEVIQRKFFYSIFEGQRKGRWSLPSIDTRNHRGVTSQMLATWVEVGYLSARGIELMKERVKKRDDFS
ncbi:hypothetical protein EVAR_81142_1 [Eumeta japonica]|uniref:Uncharacterized protein n=1 Tax=Eumeta variegata TaxID=151549 RepID=A0A4C1UL19_EUMVA|nr:hypothetical protein EVAR_81142_1 [Eumeta japonica]